MRPQSGDVQRWESWRGKVWNLDKFHYNFFVREAKSLRRDLFFFQCRRSTTPCRTGQQCNFLRLSFEQKKHIGQTASLKKKWFLLSFIVSYRVKDGEGKLEEIRCSGKVRFWNFASRRGGNGQGRIFNFVRFCACAYLCGKINGAPYMTLAQGENITVCTQIQGSPCQTHSSVNYATCVLYEMGL